MAGGRRGIGVDRGAHLEEDRYEGPCPGAADIPAEKGSQGGREGRPEGVSA